MTVTEFFDRLPPCACRILARTSTGRHSRGLSHREISIKSGLPLSTISDLSSKTTWAGQTIDVIQKFSAACGVDHFHIRKSMIMLRDGRMAYVEKGTPQQRALYVRLFGLLVSRSVK